MVNLRNIAGSLLAITLAVCQCAQSLADGTSKKSTRSFVPPASASAESARVFSAADPAKVPKPIDVDRSRKSKTKSATAKIVK